MIKEELVRQELIYSKKFAALMKNLDIMKIAAAGIINVESLSQQEREDIIIWIHKKEIEPEWENMPPIIKQYMEKCK